MIDSVGVRLVSSRVFLTSLGLVVVSWTRTLRGEKCQVRPLLAGIFGRGGRCATGGEGDRNKIK